jgi:glutamate--cysteine ligase
MTAVPSSAGGVITDKKQLTAYLAEGCKPVSAARIGTEHEKFIIDASGKPMPYEGERGIRALLEALAARFGWEMVREQGLPIALLKNGAAISLEPGGQFELSGAPLQTLHETAAELDTHLAEVHSIIDPWGYALLGQGTHPTASREDFTWMPKGRYAIMRAQMADKGQHGIDMMLRTTTVQVNLDFHSEIDMIRKFRVSLALQPIATALFANSPYLGGTATGYQSSRSFIWTDTDPDRTGMLKFVFTNDMSFEAYTEYMLDVPMYFVYRDGHYLNARGQSFRAFLNGELPALPGELPTVADWVDHLSTAFPEVRLKRYLEMRGADSGNRAHLMALSAFWVGLLMSTTALDGAADLVKNWDADALSVLRTTAPQTGFNTEFNGTTAHGAAVEALRLARHGLLDRNLGEGVYLDYLDTLVANGHNAAQDLLNISHGSAAKALLPNL